MGLLCEFFFNIGLLVGGLSCLIIFCFVWFVDCFGCCRVYIIGMLIGMLSVFFFFMVFEV